MHNSDISFFERNVELPSGFSLIWPFINLPKSNGPFELFLDNNSLIRSSWINELPKAMQNNFVLSPYHALCEQWLSNPSFRNDTVKKIRSLTSPFSQAGAVFDKNHAEVMAKLLKKNDAASRTQWILSYLYIILLYRIVFANKNDSTPKLILSSLKNSDIPMFNGCIMLCTLAGYLRENQGLTLLGDDKPAFSYISNFVDLHTKNKDEKVIDEKYLCNRAGDISMWLHIPTLMQLKYQKIGDSVVVTNDTALKKLIFRCLPAVLVSNGNMALSFDGSAFDRNHSEAILMRILDNTGRVKPSSDRREQFNKLYRLRDLVLKGAESELISTVQQTWEEWLTPGFFEKFIVS